ncbi:hypothetical protein ACR3K2_33360 [Cryptosporidium serpentis]
MVSLEPTKYYKHPKYPLIICHFDIIDSTQLWVYNNIEDIKNKYNLSPNTWIAVTSNYMTSGIGTYNSKTNNNRRWYTIKGKNISISYITLCPLNNKETTKYSSLVGALSVSNILENIGVKSVRIKWVNDIHVSGKKIGGILCKLLTNIFTFDNNGKKQQYIPFIVGIGLNVLHNQDEIPINVDYPATSVFLEKIKYEINPNICINEIENNLHFEIIKQFSQLYQNNSITLLLKQINNKLTFIGKMVSISYTDKDNDIEVVGIFEGVDNNGYAIIRTCDLGGKLIYVSHGTMRHINI